MTEKRTLFAVAHGRLCVEDTRAGGDGWTLVDYATGGCMSFETKREALGAAAFARAYLRRWGSLDWDSFPYSLDEAPATEHPYSSKPVPF